MGSGREAVVGAELRVRGMEGLRTIPSANNQAPVVMIAEFASRLIVAGVSQLILSRSP
jgi:choline dehydrogenase-like flavoprotein